MGIKVKAIERNIAFGGKEKKWAYVLQPELYSQLSQAKVINEASLRSGLSKGILNASWDAMANVITAWATEGHSVAIPGLGTMRFGLRADSIEDVAKVSSNLITARRVIFTPSVAIKQELAAASVSITCYDRNGKIVKQVTSTDNGNVEDPDNNPSGGGSTPSGGGSTSGGSQGGGSQGDNTDNPGSNPGSDGDGELE